MPNRDAPINLDELPSIQGEKRLLQEAEVKSKKENKKSTATSLSIWWLWLLVVCLTFACIVFAAFAHQQQQLLQQADLRITALESRLSNTDESLSQSSVSVQLRLVELKERTDELWEQMDKLWASAWRRNQTELKELHTKFVESDKLVTSLTKQSEKSVNQVNGFTQQQKQLSEQLNKAEKTLQQHTKELAQLKQQQNTISQKIQTYEKLGKDLAAITQQQKELSKNNEEVNAWIESNNAFRKKTNQTLNQIETRLKSLQAE